MKIETMMRAMDKARDLAQWPSRDYRKRSRMEYFDLFHRFYYGIRRRYIRLQQENAMLRDSRDYWRAEAMKDGDDE